MASQNDGTLGHPCTISRKNRVSKMTGHLALLTESLVKSSTGNRLPRGIALDHRQTAISPGAGCTRRREAELEPTRRRLPGSRRPSQTVRRPRRRTGRRLGDRYTRSGCEPTRRTRAWRPCCPICDVAIDPHSRSLYRTVVGLYQFVRSSIDAFFAGRTKLCPHFSSMCGRPRRRLLPRCPCAIRITDSMSVPCVCVSDDCRLVSTLAI